MIKPYKGKWERQMGKAPARGSNNVLGHTHTRHKMCWTLQFFLWGLSDRHEICETALYSQKELEQNFITTETSKEKI